MTLTLQGRVLAIEIIPLPTPPICHFLPHSLVKIVIANRKSNVTKSLLQSENMVKISENSDKYYVE